MAKLTWDTNGEHFYETGIKNCVLYVWDDTENDYGAGVAWNGITTITESPSGAEATAIYADNIKYLNLYSAEEFGATIEAYTYPDEFAECDGSAESSSVAGMFFGQQSRKMFALCYRTEYGNDTQGNDYGYKLHIIYGCKASPSEKSYATINDSPEAITFSWEINTTPNSDVPAGMNAVSTLTFDSHTLGAKMTTLENKLYGTASSDPTLLSPADIVDLLGVATTSITLDKSTASVAAGSSTVVVATRSPSGASSGVTWTTSDATKATVEALTDDGTVARISGVAAGTGITITATSNSHDATCTVTVTA